MSDLNEQIWEDEVERFAEDTLAMWKTQYRLWQRASSQGAPQALLKELAEVSNLLKEAHERLMALKVCFPKVD